MKVLLLGGTGAMGSHLAEILSKDSDNEIFVTTRQNRSGEQDGRIEYLVGNAHAASFLSEILQKHYDAIVDFMTYELSEFKERIDMLLKSTSQYIFLSSARVYSPSESLITEKSQRLLDVCKDEQYLRTNEYALQKAREEDLLFSAGRNNWTIIRPYITFGQNKFQLGCFEKEEFLYRALHGRAIVFSKDLLNKKTTLTYGYDVARCIAATVGVQDALGEVFLCTSDEVRTWGEILNLYTGILSRELKNDAIKSYVLVDTCDSIIRADSFYQLKYDRLSDRCFNNEKIRAFMPDAFTPIEEGMSLCLKSFINNRTFAGLNWKTEARKDKLAHEMASLNEFHSWKQMMKYLYFRLK